jgi:nitroreductase
VEINEAIRTRRSIRSFRPEQVSKNHLEKIIDVCQWAASPGNMQPWEFGILGGKTMEEFTNRLYEKGIANAPAELDFASTMQVPEIYAKRRDARSHLNAYLSALGPDNIEEKKREYFLKGRRLFGAPNAIIVYTDKSFINIPWGLLAIGIITQNVCLAAHSVGLGTCIMGGPVDWPNMIREMLGIDNSKVFLVGIAIGYPDLSAVINTYQRKRIPVNEWVRWYGVD